MKEDFGYKKSIIYLLLSLVIIFSYLVIIFHPNLPSKIGGYNSAIDYGRYHIVNYGHIPTNKPYHTWQAGLWRYGREDVLPKIHYAIINIVTGTTNFPYDLQFYSYIPWEGVFFIPFVVLMWYSYLSKKYRIKRNILDIVILYMIAVFPLASTTSQYTLTAGNTIDRGFFMLMIILFLTGLENKKRLALYSFLLFPFYCYYHTWSYYLLIVLFAIFIFSIIWKKWKISFLSLYGIATYFIVAIYNREQLLYPFYKLGILSISMSMLLNPAFFSIGYINTKYYFNLLNLLFIPSKYIGYKPFGNIYSIMQAINLFLLSIFLIIFLGHFLYRYLFLMKKLEEYEYLLLSIVVGGLTLIAVSLYLFFGNFIKVISSRFWEAGVYITLLIIPYLIVVFRKDKRKLKHLKLLYVISIIIVLICLLSIQISPYFTPKNPQLKMQDLSGICFAGTYFSDDTPIYSDFFIGTILIYYNQTTIYTIDHRLSTSLLSSLLKIYYNRTTPSIALDNLIKHKPYVVLTSHTHLERLYLPTDIALRPICKKFAENFDNDSAFCKVYSSAGLHSYYRE